MGIPWYTNPLRFLLPSKILGAAKNKTSQVRINHHFPWFFHGSPSGYPAFSMVFPSSGSLSSAPPVIPRGSSGSSASSAARFCVSRRWIFTLSCGSTFWSWRSTFFETGQIVGYMKFGWHTHTHIYTYIYTHIYIYNKVQWWICSKVHFYGYVSKFGYLEVWIRTIENHRGISIENLKKNIAVWIK